MKYLVTGSNSGLGKFLLNSLPNCFGLTRTNFNEIKNQKFDVIIHCAFNKENVILDYKKYLEDNIFLTQKLQKIKCEKFIYISSIDIYQGPINNYSLFKLLAESILTEDNLCLRCSMIVGETMKPNHLTKIFHSKQSISLSGKSTFNYILMSDLLIFLKKNDILNMRGVIDCVSNMNISLEEVKSLFNSTTVFGDFVYHTPEKFKSPIFKIYEEFNNSSFYNLNKYFK